MNIIFYLSVGLCSCMLSSSVLALDDKAHDKGPKFAENSQQHIQKKTVIANYVQNVLDTHPNKNDNTMPAKKQKRKRKVCDKKKNCQTMEDIMEHGIRLDINCILNPEIVAQLKAHQEAEKKAKESKK